MDKILKIGLLELAYLAIFILGGTSGCKHLHIGCVSIFYKLEDGFSRCLGLTNLPNNCSIFTQCSATLGQKAEHRPGRDDRKNTRMFRDYP